MSKLQKQLITESPRHLPGYKKLPPISPPPPSTENGPLLSPSSQTILLSQRQNSKEADGKRQKPGTFSPSSKSTGKSAVKGLTPSPVLKTERETSGSNKFSQSGVIAGDTSDGNVKLVGYKATGDQSPSSTTTGWVPPGSELPPCKICADKASGLHYGVYTCEACKAFFRRTLKRKSLDFQCTCTPAERKRNQEGPRKTTCPKCRYERCIKEGMSKDAIKIGRYSINRKRQNDREVNLLKEKQTQKTRTASDSSSTSKSSFSNSPQSPGQAVSSPEEITGDITALNLDNTETIKKMRHNNQGMGMLNQTLEKSIMQILMDNQAQTKKQMIETMGNQAEFSPMEQLFMKPFSPSSSGEDKFYKFPPIDDISFQFAPASGAENVVTFTGTEGDGKGKNNSPGKVLGQNQTFKDNESHDFFLIPQSGLNVNKLPVQQSGESAENFVAVQLDLQNAGNDTVPLVAPSAVSTNTFSFLPQTTVAGGSTTPFQNSPGITTGHEEKDKIMEMFMTGENVGGIPSEGPVSESAIENLLKQPLTVDQSDLLPGNEMTKPAGSNSPVKMETETRCCNDVPDIPSELAEFLDPVNENSPSFVDTLLDEDDHSVDPAQLREDPISEVSPLNLPQELRGDFSPPSKHDSLMNWRNTLDPNIEDALDNFPDNLTNDLEFYPDPVMASCNDKEMTDKVMQHYTEPRFTLGVDITEEEIIGYVSELLMCAQMLNQLKCSLSCKEIAQRHKDYLEQYTLKMQLFGRLGNLSKKEYFDFYNQTGLDIDNRQQILMDMLRFIESSIQKMVKFVKCIPGFPELDIEDQVTLLKASRFEQDMIKVGVAGMCMRTGSIVTLTPSNQDYHVEELAKIFSKEFMDYKFKVYEMLKKLGMLPEEACILRAIVITCPGRKGLKEPRKVAAVQDRMISAMHYLLSLRDPNKQLHMNDIVKCLIPLQELSGWETKIVQELFEVWPISTEHNLVREFYS